MKDFLYVFTPFVAWFVTGVLKFLTNCLREKRLAFDLIGYGGMPSNHATISSSIFFLILIRDGIDSPALGVATAFMFIVLLDASSLRRQVQAHAIELNKINGEVRLRERVAHTPIELGAGCLVGLIVAVSISSMSNLLEF